MSRDYNYNYNKSSFGNEALIRKADDNNECKYQA